MSKRLRISLMLLGFGMLVGGIALYSLPAFLIRLPGRYRVRLPEPLLELITTPLPTALPAPKLAVAPQVTVPIFITDTPTPPLTYTPRPTLTNQPTKLPTQTPTQTNTPTQTPSPTPLPASIRLNGFQIIPQTFNNCGPANLTMNLNFHGLAVTQAEVANYLKPNSEDRNVSPWQIADYVNQNTELNAIERVGGDLQLLRQLLSAGFSVVLEKGYEPEASLGWMGHYLTLVGYDDAVQRFTGMDSYLGPWNNAGRNQSYETIINYWQHFNYSFYVVYESTQEETLQEILGETLWEKETMWQNAIQKAQVEIEAEPENSFAWFNLGSSLTGLAEMTGDNDLYTNGANAFDQARLLGLPARMLWYQFRPYVAYMRTGRYDEMLILANAVLQTQGGQNVEETYLYKGHALLFQGDVASARENYEYALELNPNFYPAQWALDALP